VRGPGLQLREGAGAHALNERQQLLLHRAPVRRARRHHALRRGDFGLVIITVSIIIEYIILIAIIIIETNSRTVG
jgi:hypothetical protein